MHYYPVNYNLLELQPMRKAIKLKYITKALHQFSDIIRISLKQ